MKVTRQKTIGQTSVIKYSADAIQTFMIVTYQELKTAGIVAAPTAAALYPFAAHEVANVHFHVEDPDDVAAFYLRDGRIFDARGRLISPPSETASLEDEGNGGNKPAHRTL